MTNEEALNILHNSSVYHPMYLDALNMAIKALEQQPTRPTGHWIAGVDRWGDIVTTVNGYRCSECCAFNADKDNFCPNCGARMGESEEEE